MLYCFKKRVKNSVSIIFLSFKKDIIIITI